MMICLKSKVSSHFLVGGIVTHLRFISEFFSSSPTQKRQKKAREISPSFLSFLLFRSSFVDLLKIVQCHYSNSRFQSLKLLCIQHLTLSSRSDHRSFQLSVERYSIGLNNLHHQVLGRGKLREISSLNLDLSTEKGNQHLLEFLVHTRRQLNSNCMPQGQLSRLIPVM